MVAAAVLLTYDFACSIDVGRETVRTATLGTGNSRVLTGPLLEMVAVVHRSSGLRQPGMDGMSKSSASKSSCIGCIGCIASNTGDTGDTGAGSGAVPVVGNSGSSSSFISFFLAFSSLLWTFPSDMSRVRAISRRERPSCFRRRMA